MVDARFIMYGDSGAMTSLALLTVTYGASPSTSGFQQPIIGDWLVALVSEIQTVLD